MGEDLASAAPQAHAGAGNGFGARLCVRVLPAHEIDPGALAAWESLELRATEPNPYLSAIFLRPAFEHITPGADIRLVVVESASDSRWLAMGVFERGKARPRFPFPHWRSHACLYSMLSGVLVDRACSRDALDALLAFLADGGLGNTAIHWDEIAGDGALCKALRESPAWREDYAVHRACLRAPDWGESYLEAHLRPGLRKQFLRKERQLRAEGAPTWRLLRGADVDERCIETFLRLEDMGWRHDERTSLRGARHEAFFRDMAGRSGAHGRISFAELVRGDEVISSSCNLMAGDALFAFKIGWNPAYARLSPGMLNEILLVRELPREFPGLAMVDSCTVPGAYLEAIYRGRREIVGGHLAIGAGSARFLRGLAWAKRMKRSLWPAR